MSESGPYAGQLFPKIRNLLSGSPYDKGPKRLGSRIRPLILGNSHIITVGSVHMRHGCLETCGCSKTIQFGSSCQQ